MRSKKKKLILFVAVSLLNLVIRWVSMFMEDGELECLLFLAQQP